MKILIIFLCIYSINLFGMLGGEGFGSSNPSSSYYKARRNSQLLKKHDMVMKQIKEIDKMMEKAKKNNDTDSYLKLLEHKNKLIDKL